MFVVFSCKAQQQYPLSANPFEIPNNSYMKDSNNLLNQYIGTWNTNYQGKNITIYISKQTNVYKESLKVYQDVISAKFIVKDLNGNVLQDTYNMQPNQLYHKIESYNLNSQGDKVSLYYDGTNCGIGWGSIYLIKIDSTHINWQYRANSSVITEQSCPGNQDLKVYLPVTDNLTFTKQ